MVNEITILDRIHLQQYIYLIGLFCSKKMDTPDFERLFLQIRREDNYWLSGSINETIEKILNFFFLDVDEYNPANLFDKNDAFNIDESELRKRASDTLKQLLELAS